jgi:hypothetical protein
VSLPCWYFFRRGAIGTRPKATTCTFTYLPFGYVERRYGISSLSKIFWSTFSEILYCTRLFCEKGCGCGWERVESCTAVRAQGRSQNFRSVGRWCRSNTWPATVRRGGRPHKKLGAQLAPRLGATKAPGTKLWKKTSKTLELCFFSSDDQFMRVHPLSSQTHKQNSRFSLP